MPFFLSEEALAGVFGNDGGTHPSLCWPLQKGDHLQKMVGFGNAKGAYLCPMKGKERSCESRFWVHYGLCGFRYRNYYLG